jgi:uncharacterized protein (DUF983 family)
VSALYRTAAEFNFPAGDAVWFEYVEADSRTDDVNDRIKRANFMKGNLIHHFSVNFCFSLSDAGEYGERPPFCSLADAGLLNESANVFPCTMMVVFVRVIVMMGVCFIMMVRVRYIVMMLVCFIVVMLLMRVITMRDVIGLTIQLNHCVHTTNAAALITLKVQMPAIYAEFAQFTP